ncbi:MAG TPA: 5-deoxy-glucuronate isomerase [Levilinea sp.]|nr:5-deoxy-glucuronate isomerase [Levilinea sp.]
MLQYNSQNLVMHPGNSDDPDVVVEVSPEAAGWDTINFQVRRLASCKSWRFQTGEHELALVVLSGTLDVDSDKGRFNNIGNRENVFSGLPYALYLPRRTSFTVSGLTGCEFAVAWSLTNSDYPAQLISPADITVEMRGGDNATRHINNIIPPGFACGRLVVVEVYTPGGNWSSYPPHKHDIHKSTEDGRVLEADLDEVYFYKIDRPEGYAIQYIYTDPESPLHRAGYPIDVTVLARNNDAVLIPEGYHPVSSPPGYTTYYLNILAGSKQALTATDDPRYAWVKQSYQSLDPRVPIYDVSEAKQVD